jgi:tetratricopeptide (TPR) repeat protein
MTMRPGRAVLVGATAALAPALIGFRAAVAPDHSPAARIIIDYPEQGSVFPPDFAAPTFIWRDAAESARLWTVEVKFAGGGSLHLKCRGERVRTGEIDSRAVAATNELPRLTPEQAAARTWTPDARTWTAIKRNSVGSPATVTITGFRDGGARQAVSSGRVSIQTSKDPVGAPIFYRDVPLMPSESEKGVIKPLAPGAQPLVAWRLRNAGEARSRLLMEGLPTCANCHSFSSDGKTLGMDLDGPQNDKGLYALARVAPKMSISERDVISWSSFRDQPAGRMRVGFMSQVSPDGQHVVTTVGATEREINRNYYVMNFKDYRFLQVFYATRGILVWYNRATGRRSALPGADDPRFVQTNAVWSPDGKYLVFARAEARDPYPEGKEPAEYANDPNETQIQYDLYRIPFNDGKGGRAEPIAGASRNGMSNSFPKVSPDGRWIVFVQSRNALLMRPDSQLYIAPAEGGRARRMRCNAPPMNSWHSFSPNGRWLVFSSKRRSPYTQMYLTHIDEDGNDSPAILIENATAANRAVNLPEFVNIPPDGLQKIEVPVARFYRLFDVAWALAEKGQYEAAAAEWRKALEISPEDARAQNNLGFALANTGRIDEAVGHWRKAAEINPEYADVYRNLGRAMLRKGNFDEAAANWRKALELDPDDVETRDRLGFALLRQGRFEEASAHLRKAAALDPKDAEARYNLGVALLHQGGFDEAILHFRKAIELDPGNAQAYNDLGVSLLRKGRLQEAAASFEKAVESGRDYAQAHFNLGNVLYMLARVPEAVAWWRAGLRLEPDHLSTLNQTALVLAACAEASVRSGSEAVKLAARAVEITNSREPEPLDTLAAAYAESGRFEQAAATARRALALALQANKQALAEDIKTRIALYAAEKPFRLQPGR